MIRLALILMILLCAMAIGQKAEVFASPDPLEKISSGVEASSPSMPISNQSHLATVPASIVDTALAEDDLNVLVAAIRSAGLVELLSS
ncbi:MAG: hypothetical protein LUQ47_05900 [Methanotrichaceae archaeon]|nr:hypothetical protein [Methanotrichaceae archaeon]